MTIGSGEGIAPADVNLNGSIRVASIIGQFFLIFTWIVGVAAVFSLILAGFQYITAGGDAEKAANSRRQIVFSIIGILIAASTFAIYSAARNIAESSTSSGISSKL